MRKIEAVLDNMREQGMLLPATSDELLDKLMAKKARVEYIMIEVRVLMAEIKALADQLEDSASK